MTGFASVTRAAEDVTVSVTARSVNHRYLDLQVRAPQSLQAVEAGIRERVQARLARGRVEITISTRRSTPPDVDVAVDEALIAALVQAAERPAVARATKAAWTVGELLGFPRVVAVSERPPDREDEARVAGVVQSAVEEAIGELDSMRVREGALLRADLDARVLAFEGLVGHIAECAAAAAVSLQERLAARVTELRPEVEVDPTLLAQEVVRLAGRSDIHEELARLRAHIVHWRALADGPEPCGRKLDFLLQEMNREVNTIASKADGSDTAQRIVDAKAELEKLREQTQNVE